MKKHTVSIVNVFTQKVGGGNPAAVIKLESWLADNSLQKIASAQPTPVTAFVVGDDNSYAIRWFSQKEEINLCGHGTMAAASVLLQSHSEGKIHFTSQFGCPVVNKSGGQFSLLFPRWASQKQDQHFTKCSINRLKPSKVYTGRDLILVFGSEQEIFDFQPDLEFITVLDWHALIITAPGENCDYVLRYFVPKVGIDEDAATGSAQCSLAPLWGKALEKKSMTATQLSKRGGEFIVKLTDKNINIIANVQLDSQELIELDSHQNSKD